jgi:hypothetical protein
MPLERTKSSLESVTKPAADVQLERIDRRLIDEYSGVAIYRRVGAGVLPSDRRFNKTRPLTLPELTSDQGRDLLIDVLLFIDFHHRLTLIRAAFGAYMMSLVIFSTAWAFHQVLQRQAVMGTTAVATAAGDFAFRQWTHRNCSLLICS